MAFFPGSTIFGQDIDDMHSNSAAPSVHTESTSPLFADVDQYFSPTGDISLTPPSIVNNPFIFGDPTFDSDFNPDIVNDFSFLNSYFPSFDSVAEPVDNFGSDTASPILPHVEYTDEDAEFDLDPEFDNNSGGNGYCVEYDIESVNASTATLTLSPSSEYRDWSPSSSISESCTAVDSRCNTPTSCSEDSSDTCCSDNNKPAAGSRKRARTSKAAKSTSKSTKSKRGKKSNFSESSERWLFHDLPVEVRCLERTCDAILGSINSAIDHFNATHALNVSVRCAYFGCDETAGSVGDIRRHFLAMKHQPHRFTCNSCKTMFTRRDAMLRHVRKQKGSCKGKPMRKVPARKATGPKAVDEGGA